MWLPSVSILLMGSEFAKLVSLFVGKYVPILLKQKPLKMQMVCFLLASPHRFLVATEAGVLL